MTENVAARRDVLTVRNLHARYGESRVLHGMNFDVGEGEVVTLVGRNGAGKTTTLRAIMGLVSCDGSIAHEQRELIGKSPEYIARSGVAYCPEDRGVFASLTVEENLTLPPVVRPGGVSDEDLFALFPNLWERRRGPGSKLSGGEQQMLAIARILRTGAKLLLLDEPTEGLAPVIVREIGRTIGFLKDRGYTILLVEQNLRFASKVADRHYVVEYGVVADVIPSDGLAASRSKLEAYLGV